MQRSNLMPFFWARLVALAAFGGSLLAGCAAGGGTGEDTGDELAGAPAAPQAPAAPRAPVTPSNSSSPAQGSPSTSTTPAATSGAPVINEPAPAGGGEQLPPPTRDEAANPPANAGGDDDSDDDDSDDDDDDGGDDDGGGDDDDDGGDDDDDDDDDDDGGGDDDDDDATGVNPPPDPGAPPVAAAVTFTADIRPILLDNCARCHASGGLPNFASNDAASSYDVAFDERNSIVNEIRNGSMPADTCNGAPGSTGCVSVEDFALIQQWVAAGAPE